ncbi:hypothetical protein AbraIFM66951_006117 [Aspergillus brasiliensis]|uniref:Uncharacterized protein n=1 Tax=Aspergillus brasiliensis TaxID=319629 RepID=A0A9W6DS66_9EURO|nr:hypothetical protein AbraCBS73388_005176 [Aspergillus brasiliensis]GKZ51564.1 hypothetical protein AbraIFM66951_006117 [Aspergillus brasiliensis]
MPDPEFSFEPEPRALLPRFNVSLPVHDAEVERLRLVDAVLLRSLLEEAIRRPSDAEFIIARDTETTIQNPYTPTCGVRVSVPIQGSANKFVDASASGYMPGLVTHYRKRKMDDSKALTADVRSTGSTVQT